MNLTFVGSGSAWVYAKENYHSNMILEVNGKKLLIDCGTTIFDGLNDLDIDIFDIDAIFITHNHPDHSGGLPDMALRYMFQNFPDSVKVPLYGYRETLKTMWENTMKGHVAHDSSNILEDYYIPTYLENNDSFIFEGVEIKIQPTLHVAGVPAHSIIIDNRIFISGDSQFIPELESQLSNMEMIFHDCSIPHYPGNVHASYQELSEYNEDIRNKMWLYHYSTKNGQFDIPEYQNEKFQGFVQRGQVFQL